MKALLTLAAGLYMLNQSVNAGLPTERKIPQTQQTHEKHHESNSYQPGFEKQEMEDVSELDHGFEKKPQAFRRNSTTEERIQVKD